MPAYPGEIGNVVLVNAKFLQRVTDKSWLISKCQVFSYRVYNQDCLEKDYDIANIQFMSLRKVLVQRR